MKASLIIAVYNQAKNLELILESIKSQTCQELEIIIADDGSSDGTEAVIDTFRKACPHIPIYFLTQEDKGFRKTIILNAAIKKASSDYLIFLDGDMLLEKHFIEMHLRYKNPQHVLCGHRGVKFNEEYTNKILSGEVAFSTNPINIFIERFRGNLQNPVRGLMIHNSLIRKLAVPKRDNLPGCNFSLYKEALYKVNGFNEDILEHGYNDYELGHRIKLAGYKLIDVTKLCNTYHLYHLTRKNRREEIRRKVEKVDASTGFWCINGLHKTENGMDSL